MGPAFWFQTRQVGAAVSLNAQEQKVFLRNARLRRELNAVFWWTEKVCNNGADRYKRWFQGSPRTHCGFFLPPCNRGGSLVIAEDDAEPGGAAKLSIFQAAECQGLFPSEAKTRPEPTGGFRLDGAADERLIVELEAIVPSKPFLERRGLIEEPV